MSEATTPAAELTESTQYNVWQKISNVTNTAITPSNVIDALALAGAFYGINNMDKPKGRVILTASYLADIADGRIARATGTASPLGEKIDAAGDKLKMGYAALKLWQNNQADKPLLTAIVAQNTANTTIVLADQAINEQPVLHSSAIGKRAFMIQELGAGLNIAGKSLLQAGRHKSGESMRLAGNIVGFTGVALGLVATKGYLSDLKKSLGQGD